MPSQARCAGGAAGRGTVPIALLHADLHAFNMCSGGIIDLEGSGWGPAGYDVATAPFVPALCGLTAPSNPWFSRDRIDGYLAMVDSAFASHGLPPPTARLEELLVRRAISVRRRGHPDPALRAARRRVLRSVVDTFLNSGGVRGLLENGG